MSATAQDFEEYLAAPLAEFLADRIPRAAAKAHRRFPMVPAADFEQAMWLRVLSNPPKFGKLWDQERPGIIWAELEREGTKTGKADDRWRRTEKARAAGYERIDEHFYSTSSIRLLLEILIDAGFDIAVVMEQTLGGTDSAGVHITNPDTGSADDYTAVLMDVCTAFQCLPPGQQRLLIAYYGTNQENTVQGRWDREGLAYSMGLTVEALKMRASRAIRDLQGKLGGENPWPKRR